MSEWRDRLRVAIEVHQENVARSASILALDDDRLSLCADKIVKPAFEALAEELESLGFQCTTDSEGGGYTNTIVVVDDRDDPVCKYAVFIAAVRPIVRIQWEFEFHMPPQRKGSGVLASTDGNEGPGRVTTESIVDPFVEAFQSWVQERWSPSADSPQPATPRNG